MKKEVNKQVQGVQNLRRSGAYGSHKGPQDRPRSEQKRSALREQED